MRKAYPLAARGGITLRAGGNLLVEGGGSIRRGALTQVVGQSLLASFSAFCMNDRFDYLSSRTVLEGREVRRYDPFEDAPVEGQFDWGGFFRNLAVGTLVAVGCIALAAIPSVGPLLTGALLGAALGAAGETIYMAHKEFSSGNVRDAHEMGRDLTIATVGEFFTGACAVGMPIASLFWKALACAGINTGVNTIQRAAWSEMDDLEDKEGYIFDPEQMLVDFGNGLGIGITVPQMVAAKVYGQPKPRGGTDAEKPVSSTKGADDVDPPKGLEGSGGGDNVSRFVYENNPMDNPKAAKDIIENPDAVYGYSPNPESTRIGEYASKIDWTDPDQVAIARQIRQAYHEANEAKLQALYDQGYTIEEIATRMIEERNMSRINSYIQSGDLEGLEIVKQSNLKTYGNELGMTLEQALEKYGSYEEIINAAIRSNPGMDACTGLYDIYHGGK